MAILSLFTVRKNKEKKYLILIQSVANKFCLLT